MPNISESFEVALPAKHLGDSKNVREGLATEFAEILFILQASWRHANIGEEYSQRTADSVANPSLRTVDSVANPSWRF
jgi:hypothetical protein